ncbi:hypothetical protein [Vibrio sp. 99-70-13A1]|uniref:hypothetical protein n=1 Tax=Vibrio sp. 99-70-13A1 TaxID=2607601 RepID=UPI0014939933|nr:hypothetical protein [Vibrio sp. 99-70-13A1]NOH96045.1 hypothetical protein [Vibrio sp. 99-70-13A1]
MKNIILALLLSCLSSVSFSHNLGFDPRFYTEYAPEFYPEDYSQEVISNEHLTFVLYFNFDFQYDKERYIEAASQWLSIIKKVDGKDQHTIHIVIIVSDHVEEYGLAAVEEYDNKIPSMGIIWISPDLHDPDFDPKSLKPTILHEFAHILGVGTSSDEFVKESKQIAGNGFCMENSKAVKAYNEIYNRDYDCLPFSDDGHLYDYVNGTDKKRDLDSSGQTVPPMPHELMANGDDLGPVTLSIIDDLGFKLYD